jgi:hypothetical protein
LLAEIVTKDRKLAVDLVAHPPRDNDSSWFSKLLQPRRDVDAVSEDVSPFDHYITQIDTGA